MDGSSLRLERAIIKRALSRGEYSFWSPKRGQWLLAPSSFELQWLRQAEILALTDVNGMVLPLGRAWLELNPHALLDHDIARKCYESACNDELRILRRRREEGLH